MATRFFANEILGEFLRLFDVNLRTTLNLKGVYRGSLDFLPVQNIPDMVNGVWVNLEPNITYEPVQMPKDLKTTYNFRIVYLSRINVNENVLTQKINDTKEITDMLWDNFLLSDLALSGNPPAQILWSKLNIVELDPPEEAFFVDLSADIVATAFRLEVAVRTRR